MSGMRRIVLAAALALAVLSTMSAPGASAAVRSTLAVAPALRSDDGWVTTTRTRWTVAGVVPRRLGTQVSIRLMRGARELRSAVVSTHRTSKPGWGRYVARFRLRRAATVRVQVSTVDGAPLAGRRLHVVTPRRRLRERGPLIDALQRRLQRLHYRVRRTGVLDGQTRRAVLAFRGVVGLRADVSAGRRVVRALLHGRGRFRARRPWHGRHLEADLSARVVVLLRGRRVVRIYHASAGKRSTPTVLGSFRFFRKEPGTNATGMVDSNYFFRGYAVHGYRFVPAYPDSHGCLRVALADIPAIDRWIRLGELIDVYH